MGKWVVAGLLMMSVTGTGLAQETAAIRLLPPETEGGKPLMQALKARHSTREFGSKPLPPQVLSNLLWAASGVNRPDSGKRTAPSARDWREVDVYVTTAEGAYRYDPPTHTLKRVATGDIRKLTGVQDFVATATVNLVYVADLDKMSEASAEDKALYSATDTGFIAQNVYLFCASAGLATVVRGSVNRPALGAALGLGSHQQIILAQSVGYPAGSAR
ncbi:MAG TPA: SagB/ThcOx family dehydrogenase [Thiobacillus sp.]|nr:SagB/ThcOx family dehydrogenase [Thiobacillus sp.]